MRTRTRGRGQRREIGDLNKAVVYSLKLSRKDRCRIPVVMRKVLVIDRVGDPTLLLCLEPSICSREMHYDGVIFPRNGNGIRKEGGFFW